MTSSVKEHGITALQFLTWYVANSLYAVDAQKLLRSNPSPFVILDLSLAQVTIGILMARLITLRRPGKPTKSKMIPFVSIVTLIGLMHLSATIFTNFSYQILGSTSTLLWKLTEPFAAIILKRFILQESIPPVSFLGVVCIVAGVSFFSVSQTMITISPILLANILFPLRNVFVKLQQKRQSNPLSTEHRYLQMLTSCLPFCLVGFSIRVALEAPIIHAIPYLLRNAFLFNCYQFASIALLEKLDALTHSLANTVKRALGIILSAILLHESFTGRQISGLLLAAAGFPLYAIGKNMNGPGKITKSSLFICSLGLLLSFIQLRMNDFADLPIDLELSFHAKQTAMDRHMESLNTSQTATSFVVHVVRKRTVGQYITEPYLKNALAYKGKNVGNLVWHKAAYDKVPDFSNATLCTESFSQCAKLAPSMKPSRMVYYLPQANVFNPTLRESLFKSHMQLFDHGVIPFVTGAGIQVEFGEEIEDIKNREKHRRIAVESFRFPDGTLPFLRSLQNSSIPMMVRGDFTRSVLQHAGYTHAISAGCPSLFLNENVRLGDIMERKYEALRDRIGDKSLKVGLNLGPKLPGLNEFLLKLFKKYPNSLIFIQGGFDAFVLSRYGLDSSRIRIHATVDEWEKSLSEMDVVIGGRIHGNMLALGVSIPVFVIAPDYRVLELVERMKIPHMTAFDSRLEDDDFDVAKFVSENGINAKEFDENRCRTAKIYRETFGLFGMRVSSYVRQISEIC